MEIEYSRNGVMIRLTNERWAHIVRRHPEMIGHQMEVRETIMDPGMIQQGDFGKMLAIRWYNQTSLGAKYIVVVYRELDVNNGFIITAYLTRRPSDKRLILWKR